MAFPRPLFQTIAIALFGERWQTAMASALNVSDRTVRRWAAGDQTIPDTVAEDLYGLVVQRRLELDELITKF